MTMSCAVFKPVPFNLLSFLLQNYSTVNKDNNNGDHDNDEDAALWKLVPGHIQKNRIRSPTPALS